MGERTLRPIIVIMSVALIGLVGIQLYWINSAVKLREQRFHNAVNEALNGVVYQYDKLMTADRLSMQMDFEQRRRRILMQMDSINRAISATQSGPTHQERFKLDGNNLWKDYDPDLQIDVYEEFLVDSGGQLVKRSRQRQFRAPVFAPLRPPHDLEQKDRSAWTTDSLNHANQVNMQWIERRAEMVNEIFEELVNADLYTEQHDLDPDMLDSLLQQQFADKGIGASYVFGIFDPFMNPFHSDATANDLDGLLASQHRVNVTPGNVFTPPMYLSVFFPDEGRYLLRTMWVLLIGSALLILVIIFSFWFTVSTIYRQKQVSEIKNDFINNMTHELKTPISTISLACQALADPDIKGRPGIVDNYIRVIGDENKRLAMVVENVLRTAVMDKGELKLKIQELDIHAIITHVSDTMRLQLEQKGGEITLHLDARDPVVEADQVHLTNVVFNLIDNALKYTENIPLIKVGTRTTENGVILFVEDNGIGISKENQNRIFEKLYRVPTGNVHNVKGFGLGLSYVQAIVEKHHGWVTVKSELGKGSRFEIFVPHDYSRDE
ncbi:MAG: HAMP domain-containing histidine kinase [Flavobacteriales bacterium]|nr:HAMP domain-containing histidine kinase [Flavobacteriales bacterium]